MDDARGAGQPLCVRAGDERAAGLADIAIAAICSPLAMPPLYAKGKYAEWFEQVLAKDAAARAEVEAFRATPLGKHVLKVYAACRMEPLPSRI